LSFDAVEFLDHPQRFTGLASFGFAFAGGFEGLVEFTARMRKTCVRVSPEKENVNN
jgi:hypothetical protein